jgi:hypothetical protein
MPGKWAHYAQQVGILQNIHHEQTKRGDAQSGCALDTQRPV